VHVCLFDTSFFSGLEKSIEVGVVRMDTTIRDEAEEVETTVSLGCGLKGINNRFLM
jgi:hypothetical protein